MTTAPRLIRALLVAAVCIAASAAWTPAALGQVVDPGPTTDVTVGDPPPPPPADPAPEPTPPPVDSGPAVTPPTDPPPPPPADPPVEEVAPPPETIPVEPVIGRPFVEREQDPVVRSDASREIVPAAAPVTTTAATPSDDLYAAPAELPPAEAGQDWSWTEKGDAFVFGSGGSDGGGGEAVLARLISFGSIATAAARAPGLAHQRADRRDAQGNTSGTDLVLVESTRNTLLFFNLFGGGGGGGAALVMLTALGLLTVFRMLPPDWHTAFRNSTAVWRPSAYIPPIERPG